jgi:hypothetical protein
VNNKKWLIRVLVGSLSVITLNTLFLYITDTYGIANPKGNLFYTIPNQRFAVVEYLLENKNKYDTFIFGSSKVGSINPNHFKNKKAYNVTIGAGIPHEHLLLLKLLLKNNVNIKHIYIGLDDFSPHVTLEQHEELFDLKSHYLTTESSRLKFYLFYFMRNIKSGDRKHFKYKFFEKNLDNQQLLADIQNTIFYQKKFYEDALKIDLNNNVDLNNTKFEIPIIVSTEYNNILNTVEDIENIIQICKENNITYSIVVNPIHKTTYEAINLDNFNDFKKRLSFITSYYDFSEPSFINNNNEYWHETSHYTMEVGNMILSKIYDNNSTIKDFGIYIEKQKKDFTPDAI